MSKTLILTDPRCHNKPMNVPVDGVIHIGPKGEVAVSEKAAKVLLTIDGWVEATPENVKKVAKSTKKGAENDDQTPDPGKVTVEESDDTSFLQSFDLAELDNLESEQLLELASIANLNVPGAMRTNKKSLITFLRNRLKEKLA